MPVATKNFAEDETAVVLKGFIDEFVRDQDGRLIYGEKLEAAVLQATRGGMDMDAICWATGLGKDALESIIAKTQLDVSDLDILTDIR